jgi:hypothetical protein
MIEFLQNYQSIIHYGLHFVTPLFLAYLFFRKQWRIAWAVMITTMLVDLDHLFSNPIFDPGRCSIGFHVLHSYPAIGFYCLLLFVPNLYVQIAAVGLLFHMFTDWQDCQWK